MIYSEDKANREMTLEIERLKERKRLRVFSVLCAVGIVLLVCVSAYAYPRYKIYSAEMRGRAALTEAVNSKKVKVEEAKANLESEKLNAQAEVIRAQGVSDAIDIEGGKITDAYIKYLWVKNLSFAETEIIYLPTENGLPVLNRPVDGE